MDDTFERCGHPRIPENLKRVGQSARTGETKYGCRICQRASTARSWRRWNLRGGPLVRPAEA